MEIKESDGKQDGTSGWELFRFGLVLLIIVIPLRLFVAQPFVVSGSSMFPTFEDKNYLIVDELSYRLGDPKRNDVIIFKYPKDEEKYFIKRIIGLPNETVEIDGSTVTIISEKHKDGFVLDEPYVQNKSEGKMHFELKNDEYFVMGDNRSASSDSRYWGAVPRNLIVGRSFARLWPIKKIDILPGKYVQAE